MINSLWVAKTGMQAQQTQLDVISHNLANVSTSGFKRGTAVFEDLIYQNLRQVGAASTEQTELPTGLQLGLGVRTVATSRNYSQGNLQQSGNNLDLAVNGDGFFQIQQADGTTAYTRDGAFQVNSQGQMVTSGGYLLSGGITIPADARSVTINNQGQVSVVQGTNAAPTVVGQIELASFINPAGLEARGQNLFTETAASGNPITGAPGSNGMGPVMQGYLETSNVNVVQELVTMIQTQRAYEMNSKAIQTSDQMLAKLGQL
ncbi:MAG: flagellar basal-body rod protein FlgG [Burkholderiaceae bacterium]